MMEKGDFVNKAIEKSASVAGQTYALLAIRLELRELKEAVQKQTEVMKNEDIATTGPEGGSPGPQKDVPHKRQG